MPIVDALRNRRMRSVIRRARDWFSDDLKELNGLTHLDDQTRLMMAQALRSWNVRTAAGTPALLRYAFWPALTAATIVGGLGPFAAVWFVSSPSLKAAGSVLALSLYAVVGMVCLGMVTAWGIVGSARTAVISACWIGGAIGAVAGVSATVYLIAHRDGVEAAAAAGVGLAAAILGLVFALVLQSLGRTFVRIATTVACRRCGSMTPSRLVAVQIFYVAAIFRRLGSTWKQADTRKRLMWRLAGRANFIGYQIPRLQWLVGGSGVVRVEAQERCRRAATVLGGMQWRLAEAYKRQDYDALCEDITAMMAAAATGDWARLAGAPESNQVGRLRSLARRLIAPGILIATAASLPYLPGVATGQGVITIQIGLAAAAILSLTSADSSTHDRILSALSGISGHGP